MRASCKNPVPQKKRPFQSLRHPAPRTQWHLLIKNKTMALPLIFKAMESSSRLSKVPPPTGGTITTYSSDRVHTFLASSTDPGFVTFGPLNNICILLVGGGRDRGRYTAEPYVAGAGGGGGSFLQDLTNFSIAAGSYPIYVGGGGRGAYWETRRSTNGGTTVALGRTAIGGGGGAWRLESWIRRRLLRRWGC
jgi:hypothetical protein